MKSTFELGMTLDYVKSWGIVEAVREFFQNCIDESIINPENKWFSEYDEEHKVLRIGNVSGKITPTSLLLGSSTKSGDDKTLGEHGEGYKVGIIVLQRTNHPVTIYNCEAKEKWTARTIKSKRYNANIVAVDVETSKDLKPYKGNNLVFVIGGVTSEEYEAIKKANLWLREGIERYQGMAGSCLVNSEESGNIYINGLFVKNLSSVRYGWDFNAGVIKLDRDRNTLDSFDVKKSCSILAKEFTAEQINQVKDAPECQWLMSYIDIDNKVLVEEKVLKEEKKSENSFEEKMQKVYDDSLEKFYEEHGKDVVPVATDVEFNRLAKAGKTCVKLDSNEYEMVTRAKGYVPVEESESEESLSDLVASLEVWYKENIYAILSGKGEELLSIITKLKEKVNG